MSEVEHVIIGTAGHIDHGKTLLVKALTGIDADTLAEEKRRGITIELGFIFMEASGYDKQIVFIDVPGHEKLVKTMVAGASNIDAALLVIAADEGISMQTREHFDILNLLGIERGIVALTKADLVNEEQILELKDQAKSFLKGSFLGDAPIIPVSSVSGTGVDDLKQALLNLGKTVEIRQDSGIFRMPIDRVFTMCGFGTVIAGTILSGEVKEGDRIEIFPDKLTVKVRGIQVHHQKVERSTLGKRTALNLQDIKKEKLRRGQCAGKPGSLTPTYRLDGRLHLLKSYVKQLKNRTRVRLHVGTEEIISRLVLLEGDILLPGNEALVQFVLESPTVSLPGDPFVIRTFSPLMTIGGGKILDSAPLKHKRFDSRTLKGLQRLEGDIAETVEQVVMDSGSIPLSSSEVRIKIGEPENAVDKTVREMCEAGQIIKISGHKEIKYLHKNFYADLEKKLTAFIKSYLEKNPHRMFMPYEELRSRLLKLTDNQTFKTILDGLLVKKIIDQKNSDVSLVGFEVKLKPQDQELIQKIENIFKRTGFSSPLPEEIRVKMRLKQKIFMNLMHSLHEKGVLVRLSERVIYHRDSFEQAKRIVMEHLKINQTITVAELRDKLKLSRKYATAILEYFDNIGLTKREKDAHILK
ncbi:MAG: selenocysteine-specific translation elongation factor [Candidatus Aminicenantes bacterium]|nr:MAG: selenocysteine-specific translation elongation factor [Candidatus Aminicenantes bacterium]